MKCPPQLAGDLSAGGGGGMRHSAVWRQNAYISTDRLGAGDEGSRGDFEGAGEADHVVAGGGDSRHLGPEHAALAGPLRAGRLRWAVRPTPGPTEPQARAAGDRGRSAAALSGALPRLQRAALSREVAGRAWHPAELHVGQAGVAGSGAGEEGAEARRASQAAPAAAFAGDAAAPGWESSPVVSG